MAIEVTFLNILWVLSFFSTVYMSTAFHISGRNPLLKIFCITTALMSLNTLLSMIYNNKLENAPRAFCIFQALFLQFNTFAQDISALCFSIHVYRLIVLKINDTSIRIKKGYYVACAVYTVTFTTILGVVASHHDSIQPRVMNCDVLRPAYVRLLGYAGVNVVFALPGIYFSAHSAFIVFRHLERFKTSTSFKSSNKSNNTLVSTQEQDNVEITDHKNIYLSDIENSKDDKNENEMTFGSLLPPQLLPVFFNDEEENNINLSGDEGSKDTNETYEMKTFPSPILPPLPPPVFFNNNEENIDNKVIHLSDSGVGENSENNNNNKHKLSMLLSPLLSPQQVIFKNNEGNSQINDNEINSNIKINSVVVNKSNNNVKNTYIRINNTPGNEIKTSHDNNNDKIHSESKNIIAIQSQQKISTQERLQKKTYNTTKAAAIRMAVFSLFFIIINFLGSLNTIKVALTGEEFKTSIQLNDIIGSMIGMIVTAVFCTSSEVKRIWRR